MIPLLHLGEYEAVVAVVERKPYKASAFARAMAKLMYAVGHVYVPRTPTEWRANPSLSRALLDRHQAACAAADREYARVLMEIAAVTDPASEETHRAPPHLITKRNPA